jgi:transcriptional regulator with XRE-family HTH domain
MYEIFERLLKEKGVKTADVSRATGISSTVFSEWKKGKSKPKTDKLQKIADFFNVPIDYFSGRITSLYDLDNKIKISARERFFGLLESNGYDVDMLKDGKFLITNRKNNISMKADDTLLNSLEDNVMNYISFLVESKISDSAAQNQRVFSYQDKYTDLLNAAHERTDVDIDECDRKHDNDIMDDENF